MYLVATLEFQNNLPILLCYKFVDLTDELEYILIKIVCFLNN